jgi:hypothetical protein
MRKMAEMRGSVFNRVQERVNGMRKLKVNYVTCPSSVLDKRQWEALLTAYQYGL